MNENNLTRNDLSALVPQYPSNFIHKKLAFTLAEVLVTLGIIGIVAALTLPSFISKYKGYVTANKLRQVYSILNSCAYMIEQAGWKIPKNYPIRL